MAALFRRKQKLHTCVLCSALVPDELGEKMEHYQRHLIPVTNDAGEPAFTFSCPRCGPSDLAWTREHAAYAGIAVHQMERHGDHSLM